MLFTFLRWEAVETGANVLFTGLGGNIKVLEIVAALVHANIVSHIYRFQIKAGVATRAIYTSVRHAIKQLIAVIIQRVATSKRITVRAQTLIPPTPTTLQVQRHSSRH